MCDFFCYPKCQFVKLTNVVAGPIVVIVSRFPCQNPPDAQIGQREHLSEVDLAKLMNMYECDSKKNK